MKRVIYKYELDYNHTVLVGAPVEQWVSVALVDGKPVAYALIDDITHGVQSYVLGMYWTGERVPEDWTFLGTIVSPTSGLVYHVMVSPADETECNPKPRH